MCVSTFSSLSLSLSVVAYFGLFSPCLYTARQERRLLLATPHHDAKPLHIGTVRCSTRAVQHSQESGFSFCFYCKMTWPHRRRRVWLPAHLAGAAARFSNTKRASLIPIIEGNRSTSSLFARLSSSWGLL